ncbi:hypothetical protein [Enterococcus casseliflavus]|uniref:hypothetical protein n=1 Tax=Enterococcus casseliflavus TaxID=37734 RepID=UPI0029554C1B|nr:hypothetical protein [Enterococcus casseliflavus]MDV7737418.1 hypothetical protein [Enterococcus casseliflavus]
MKRGFFTNITKIFLYLSSFFPLFILLVIQNIKIRNNEGFYNASEFFNQFFIKRLIAPESIFWITVFLFIATSILSIVLFIFGFVTAPGDEASLIGTNFDRADTLGYIVTYIVPLISMDISSYRSLVINFSLFFVIGIFYIKNNQFFMNPIFNLMGYNILSSDGGCIYVTKLSPREMKEISNEHSKVLQKFIADDIYIVKKLTKDPSES